MALPSQTRRVASTLSGKRRRSGSWRTRGSEECGAGRVGMFVLPNELEFFEPLYRMAVGEWGGMLVCFCRMIPCQLYDCSSLFSFQMCEISLFQVTSRTAHELGMILVFV